MQYLYQIIRAIIYVLMLGSTSLLVQAQELSKVQLIDLVELQPIQGATYQYDGQQGVSDDDGYIYFQYLEGQKMHLSHINYGNWQWTSEMIQNIIKDQVYYRESIANQLYPVTIIAVREDANPSENLLVEFQDKMAHDGTSILLQSPALNSVRKSGNYGFDPVLRGFKYDQLNIVFNGAQSATAACPNRMDPPTSQMAPNMMHRIEVLKGPYALRYGTGFGGTINFVESPSRFSIGQDLYGRVSSGVESNGNVWKSEAQIGIRNDKIDWSMFSAWSQGEDYTAGNDQIIPADFSRGSFGSSLGIQINQQHQFRLNGIYNVARDVDFAALPMDLREDDTWMFNASHDYQANGDHFKAWKTTLFASFVDHLMDNLLKPLDPRMMNANTRATTANYGGRTEGQWQYKNSKMYLGTDLRVEGAEGSRERQFLLGPNAGKTAIDNAWQDSKISKVGFFGEYHHMTEAYRIIISSRLEWNTAKINDPADEYLAIHDFSDITQINPSVSLGLSRWWNNNIETSLWLGRAQRSAGLTERFINYFPVGQDPYEMLGNPELDPEVNNQLDVNVKWQKNNNYVQVNLFASYLQDYISSVIDPNLSSRLPNSPGVRQYVNIDAAWKSGFEMTWRQDLTDKIYHQVGMAYTYAQDLEIDEPLPEIAPFDLRYTMGGKFISQKFKPEIVFRHVMEQSRISTEFGESTSPAFSLVDLNLSYHWSSHLHFSAGVINLLDETYAEHLTRNIRSMANPIYAPGRNIFTAVSWQF